MKLERFKAHVLRDRINFGKNVTFPASDADFQIGIREMRKALKRQTFMAQPTNFLKHSQKSKQDSIVEILISVYTQF